MSDLRETILKEFKHPIGSSVWWVGMEYDDSADTRDGFVMKMVKREVIATRITTTKDESEKQIFLSGLTSYEGENWFDDEFNDVAIRSEGGECVMCSCCAIDGIFNNEEDARKYLEVSKLDFKLYGSVDSER